MDVLLFHINQTEKFIVKPPVAALPLAGADRIVFINAEYLHIGKGNVSGLVPPDKLLVERYRCCTCSQPQFEATVLRFLDCVDDDVGDFFTCILGFFENLRRDFLVAMQNVFRESFLYQASVLGQCKMFHLFLIFIELTKLLKDNQKINAYIS